MCLTTIGGAVVKHLISVLAAYLVDVQCRALYVYVSFLCTKLNDKHSFITRGTSDVQAVLITTRC